MRLRENDIGGGVVRRHFTKGSEKVLAGRKLTREDVLSIRPANRNSLIDKGFIEVYPRGDAAAPAGERHAYHTGGGRFDVVQGVVLESGLTKEEASDMVRDGAAPS